MKKNIVLAASAAVLGVVSLAGAQQFGTPAQHAANVYLLDKVGYGAVSVWVDGQKIIDGNFVGSPTLFARHLPAGKHTVVVTPFYAKPGVKDIAHATLNLPAGVSTIHVANLPSSNLSRTAYLVPTLYMTQGAPN